MVIASSEKFPPLVAIAQEMAQKEGLGIWNGNPQPPWLYRKVNKEGDRLPDPTKLK